MCLLKPTLWSALILAVFLPHGATASEEPQREKINLPGFEQGDLFVLQRKANEQLVRYERSEWVCVAILIREGLDLSYRKEAIAQLAKLRSTDEVTQILDGITRAAKDPDGQTGALNDLIGLLVAALPAELKKHRASLTQLATSANHPLVRQAGFAGTIRADGAVDSAWQLAEESQERFVDLMGAVPMVSDPTVLEALYPKVTQLVHQAPSQDIRQAAILVLGSVAGHEKEAFLLLARFINDGSERDTAISALLRLPTKHWPSDQLETLADSAIQYMRGINPTQRNTPKYHRARDLVTNIASLSPEARAQQLRKVLDSLGIRVVTIRTVPYLMQYDKVHLVVQAGQPIQITLENPDAMSHNLVIVQPGALAEVGIVASQMLEDSENWKGRAYVPNSDKVLFASHLVKSKQTDTMTFVAPETMGEYPYVCTFPGHWVLMNGILHVVQDVDAWIAANPVKATGADPQARKLVKAWKVVDLAKDLDKLDGGRRLERGKELFTTVSCNACHEIGPVSERIGPGLAEVTSRLKPVEMLAAIIEPSRTINEKYQTWVVFTEGGLALTGIITRQDDEAIYLVQNPLASAEPIRIARDQVESMEQSKVSTMPMGLLNTLTKNEILDLLAYIRSGGSS